MIPLPVHLKVPDIVLPISASSGAGFGISIFGGAAFASFASFFGSSFLASFAGAGAFASPATATEAKPTLIASAIEIWVKLFMALSPLPSGVCAHSRPADHTRQEIARYSALTAFAPSQRNGAYRLS